MTQNWAIATVDAAEVAAVTKTPRPSPKGTEAGHVRPAIVIANDLEDILVPLEGIVAATRSRTWTRNAVGIVKKIATVIIARNTVVVTRLTAGDGVRPVLTRRLRRTTITRRGRPDTAKIQKHRVTRHHAATDTNRDTRGSTKLIDLVNKTFQWSGRSNHPALHLSNL